MSRDTNSVVDRRTCRTRRTTGTAYRRVPGLRRHRPGVRADPDPVVSGRLRARPVRVPRQPRPVLGVRRRHGVPGCSHWGVLFRIMLPLARPGLVSIGIFQFLGMWNEYLLPLVLNTDERRYLVTQGLANIAVTQGYHSDFSGLFAGLTLSILPVLAVYLVFHKQISTGMTAGALK